MPRTASDLPFPYLSPQNPLLHSGVVAVGASPLTVDLGLGHNGFVPTVSVNGAVAGVTLAWAYGTKAGTFVITASAPANVSFTAIAGASVA